MQTKLVIRILGRKEELLGWAEAVGEARGDGKIWISEPTLVLVEQDGTAMYLSMHWCDVNVEIRSLIEQHPVKQGDVFNLPGEMVAFVCGPAAGGLPPVTVRNAINIGIPVGSLGARGHG
jgi:hypothetical protein